MLKLRFRKHHVKYFILLVVSVAIALLVGEAGLRFAYPALAGEGYYIWPPGLNKVFEPSSEIMAGISGLSRFSINSVGLRGDEPDPLATYRILTIGGSTTECLYLDQNETWPYLLQQALNQQAQPQRVWVGNGGMSGRTAWHHLTALQYLPLDELQIDAVIVMVGINDLTLRLSQDTAYDPDPMAKPDAQKWLLLETFPGSKLLRPGDSWIRNTALWRLFWQVMASLPQENVQDQSGRMSVRWREHRQHAQEIRDELPDLSSALETYASNLNKMIDVANDRSVRLILVTQPTLWRPDLPEDLAALLWLGGVGKFQSEDSRPYYSVSALDRAMQAYNDTLLQICRQRKVDCVDLASMLEKDTTVFYDDVHFNESGARKVAAVLADYLSAHSPLD